MTTQDETVSLLSQRLVEGSAYQMFERAQGYFQIIDYNQLFDLAWYSDDTGHWHCAFAYGKAEEPYDDCNHHRFEVAASDTSQLEEQLLESIRQFEVNL